MGLAPKQVSTHLGIAPCCLRWVYRTTRPETASPQLPFQSDLFLPSLSAHLRSEKLVVRHRAILPNVLLLLLGCYFNLFDHGAAARSQPPPLIPHLSRPSWVLAPSALLPTPSLFRLSPHPTSHIPLRIAPHRAVPSKSCPPRPQSPGPTGPMRSRGPSARPVIRAARPLQSSLLLLLLPPPLAATLQPHEALRPLGPAATCWWCGPVSLGSRTEDRGSRTEG